MMLYNLTEAALDLAGSTLPIFHDGYRKVFEHLEITAGACLFSISTAYPGYAFN